MSTLKALGRAILVILLNFVNIGFPVFCSSFSIVSSRYFYILVHFMTN